MPVDATEPLSAAAIVVVFTIALIAIMQAVAWLRQREPGMQWFAVASLVSTLLVGSGLLSLERVGNPKLAALLPMYAVRGLFALGLVESLGDTPRRRRATLAVLVFPLLAFGAAMLAGATRGDLWAPAPGGLWASTPMFWADAGLAATCLAAARRRPRVGHAFVTIAPLIGPAGVVLEIVAGREPRPGLHFLVGAIGFGIIVLVVALMRRTADSRLAQAHAQTMSNYYAALSHANQAIQRIKDPAALYAEICRICVASARATIACVYEPRDQLMHRVASAGDPVQILDMFPQPWDFTGPEEAGSYTAQVLREGRRLVSNDFQNDPRAGHRRPLALRHGVRASAFLPLRRGGHTVAALIVATDEAGLFDDALVQLLDELTADISNALDDFDREAERLESARQVKAGLDRFARLFEAAPAASAIISIADRRVVDVNDAMCKSHGVARSELIGRTTDSLTYRAVADERERFYAMLACEGRVRNLVVHMVDGEGRVHAELMNAEPIDHLGQPCVLFMSLDISDMQAAEKARSALEEVQAASHAKTQFLSRMSHELRTPLNAMLGFSGLVRHTAAERLAPQELEQLDHIQQAGWHLLRLINDVLDVSRIEAGQFGIELRGVELAPLVAEAIQMSQPLAMGAGITLRAIHADGPAAWVLADPTRLRQVLLNLLSNATKYNREDGSVEVGFERREGQVRIEVVDTGVGMDVQQLAHLFEPFNRLGRDRQGYEGTGIGLALARQLMLLMNGQIHVSSEPGRGTRVALTLPDGAGASVQPAAPLPIAVPAAAELAPPSGSVLYIEDNAVNTLLVERLLARWSSVRFSAAQDGRSGLHMAAALQPDLVLLDMQLPDLDGMEVLRRLRADEQLRDTPVIVLSASAMPEEIALARSHGATDYWTKPLDFQRFLTGVARTLASATIA